VRRTYKVNICVQLISDELKKVSLTNSEKKKFRKVFFFSCERKFRDQDKKTGLMCVSGTMTNENHYSASFRVRENIKSLVSSCLMKFPVLSKATLLTYKSNTAESLLLTAACDTQIQGRTS